MAIIPFYRIQDNFLFHQTGDPPHDQVLHTASIIALIFIACTAIALVIIRATNPGAPCPDSRTWASRASATAPAHLTQLPAVLHPHHPHRNHHPPPNPPHKFIWTHAPELAFLQFPWRLLAIQAAVLALAIALALSPLKLKPATTTFLAITIAAALTYPAYQTFHQPCDPEDTVKARVTLFHSTQGTDPTDEYTPTTADNDSLAHTNPPYWLSPNPNSPAPTNAQPGPAPTRLHLNSPIAQTLILNLRNYPNWRITLNRTPITAPPQRNDGLITLPLPAGPSTIDITYNQTHDQTLGDAISAIALIILALILIRRKGRTEAIC